MLSASTSKPPKSSVSDADPILPPISAIVGHARSPEGETGVARAFETDVWQRIDGEWKVVSLHYTEITPEE